MTAQTYHERAPLGHLFPRPFEVPKHVERHLQVTPEAGAVVHRRFDPATGKSTDATRVLRISPWRGGRGLTWWRLHRAATWTYGPETQEAHVAIVYLNGGGSDPELRFVVHDLLHRPTFTTHLPSTQYGAANDFIRVSPGLRRALDAVPGERDSLWNLGPRGLFMPRKADVLIVLAWVDTLLARLYGWHHNKDAPGGLNDPLDACRRGT